jgi:hypothetical protein
MGGQTKTPRELGLARRCVSVFIAPSYRTIQPDPLRSVAQRAALVKPFDPALSLWRTSPVAMPGGEERLNVRKGDEPDLWVRLYRLEF